MATKMKAAVVREFGKPLQIEEADIPTPGAGEIVVNIQASGVCHTDLHAVDGDWRLSQTHHLSLGMKALGLFPQLAAASNMSKKVTESVCLGCIPPVVFVSIVWAAGKPYAKASKIQATLSMVALPNTP